MKNKNYYTFAEVILALRNHYLQSQILMDEMKQQIRIESKEPFYSDFELLFKNDKKNDRDESKVILKVTKNHLSSPATFIRNTLNNINHHNYCEWDKDHTYFDIMNDQGFYYLISMKDTLYHPKAFIPLENQKKFASCYEKLKQMKLFSLEDLFIKLSHYQNVSIVGTGIFLNSNGENGKRIIIYYDVKNDKICIKSDRRYTTYFVEMLLETKIPNYEFSEDYLSILESDANDINAVYIDDSIGKKKETLLLEEKIKKMVLKRV